MRDGFEDAGNHGDRVAELFKEAAGSLPAKGDPEAFVEGVLARSTDRLFPLDSPLGNVYVGVGERGVRMVGRADSPEESCRRYG